VEDLIGRLPYFCSTFAVNLLTSLFTSIPRDHLHLSRSTHLYKDTPINRATKPLLLDNLLRADFLTTLVPTPVPLSPFHYFDVTSPTRHKAFATPQARNSPNSSLHSTTSTSLHHHGTRPSSLRKLATRPTPQHKRHGHAVVIYEFTKAESTGPRTRTSL
jgi:hypothetical protein